MADTTSSSSSSGSSRQGASTDPTHYSNKDVPQFVTPKSYLRPRGSRRSNMNTSSPPNPLDREQLEALVSLSAWPASAQIYIP